MTTDYILVGHGLAGAVLAHQLLDCKQSLVVYNLDNPRSSSRVAGGIFNPITGRKMVKTWKADELFPFLFHFYKKLEKKLGASFFHPLPICRPFLSPEEHNNWTVKGTEPEYAPYVEKVASAAESDTCLRHHFGSLILRQTGYVDLSTILESSKLYLKKLNAYKEEAFDESLLQFEKNGISYQGIKAKKIIFCNGEALRKSKYFGRLPFRLVKGEVLDIQSDKLPKNKILNRGAFVLPCKDHFRAGATYDWQNLSLETTEKACGQLCKKLDTLLSVSYEVIGQQAGIRPATFDRRPFVGVHPEYPDLAVFNGLGTKGVSLAPYFGDQLVRFLVKKSEKIDPEVDMKRVF
ncbi:MAG: FAD-dependent oxidoreductase [Cytophagales bacterium]|nr:FAD-dependent oxidoreductase [Cytophagales bacterium]